MQLIQGLFSKFLIVYMMFLPLTIYAAPLQTDGTTQTTLGQAGNGVPVVNIANPNASGLSHNKFTQYNVNANGLILNNATRPTATTQLGGVIVGNAQLTAPAKVILNEVTSTNRSSLNGYTEVAGPRTDLVIANPNGLTINGAGFINTGNVTLTTGKPVIVGGALKSLNVTGGDIAIQGTGLNTSGQTSTSIYTQYLNLNAKLHTQNLDIKLGGNSVDYATGLATSNGAANARTVLLDTSALGGMYANAITLVGTDAGLGVNLPPEVLASAGDITISNDGTIILQKVSATNNINITSANGVTLNKNLYSGINASITAGSNINVNAGVVAATKHVMTINAAQLSNAGATVAGVNANQTQNTTGTMNITATTLNNTGDIQSTGNLTASGTSLTNDGVFNAGNDLTLNTSNLTNNKTLFAGNNMNLYTTGTLSNTANSNIFAMNNLTMSANAAGGKSASIINTQADIQALNGNINVNALSFQNTTNAPTIGVSNSTSGTASIATDFLQARAKEAQLLSGGNINLNADMILNQYSLLSAAGNINLTSNSLTNQFLNLIEKKTTPTVQWYWTTVSCGAWNQGNCQQLRSRTVNVVTNTVIGQVSSTIQAGGNITGNVGNLNSLGITPNKVITTAPTSALQQTLPANNTLAISLPAGTQGLFVVSTNPQSSYLIVTNPKFAIFGNFISSTFLLNNLNFSSDRTLKLLGDAFYETQLIRNSVFAQTGRRFLNSNITSDTAQYQYLMDNALAAQQDLQLIPGVSLTQAQMALLKNDIVWLEEQEVAGEKVLVPMVYIANAEQYKLEGGMIVAGDDVNLLISNLNNQGLLEVGNNLTLQADGSIINQNGTIRAGNNVSLTAQNDIKNISALIAGKNIALVASNGNIINQRQTKTVTNRDADGYDTQTQIGLAGSIQAKNALSLQAGENISIEGSRLKGQDVSLAAKEVTIITTVNNFDSFAGSHGSYIKEQSTEHLASNIEGENVAINSTGITTVRGGNVHADKNLNITAKAIDIVAVNDSSYRESKLSSKGFLSKSETTSKKATSINIASNVSGGNVTLSTINNLDSTAAGGDINIIGSNLSAKETLALNSAGNINVQAGFDGTLDETHSKKSGWFTGGALFSKSEDLEGKLTKTAALANLSGGNVLLNANKDIALLGVNVVAEDSLTGRAQNIRVENVNNEEKTYSKHTKLTVSMGDVAKMLTRPDKMVTVKDGKASVTLAKAEYSKADKVTTRTEVVSSNLAANNINLTASSDDDVQHSETRNEHGDDDIDASSEQGNITIKGSNLTAKNDKVNGEAREGALGYVNLTADGDVTIIEAKNTEKTVSKEMKGKAELKVVVQHEAIVVVQAGLAVKKAKDSLSSANKLYAEYKQELSKLKTQLTTWQLQKQQHLGGINQDDIAELQSIIHDLEGDSKWHVTNIATAGASIIAATKALYDEIDAAGKSTSTYEFNAGLELELDATKTNSQSQSSRAVASNLNAQNINIRSNNTATIQGSNLSAQEQINITAKELNILSSQNTEQSSSETKHGNITISKMIHGSSEASVSASVDRSKSSSGSLTHNNAQLNANQINLNSTADTHIKGANLNARDKLVANVGGNLNIESEYDTAKRRSLSTSMGLAYARNKGVSSGGASYGNSKLDMRYRGVGQQTSIQTGDGGFNITTKGNTNLRGSVIKSSKQAIQAGNNQLTTATLTTSDMRNTSRADAKSMGLALSTDMLQEGKYGIAKAVAGALLNNGEGKRQTIGKTVSAMSTAHVHITDDAAQQALTGQTVQQAVDAINVDTIYTHLKADQANAEAAQQMAQTKQALKMAVYRETVKFADEAYRTLFLAEHPIYEITIDPQTGKKSYVKLDANQAKHLKKSADGKVHIAANGVFTGDINVAGQYVLNQQTSTGPQYLIHFPEAQKVDSATGELLSMVGIKLDNIPQEMLVTAYQKYLENDFWGLSKSVEKLNQAGKRYGKDGLHYDGYSRGSLSVNNSLQSQGNKPNSKGSLSNTTVHMFGPAADVQQADARLANLQDRQSQTPARQKELTLKYLNQPADPVGRAVGGNAETPGGTIPKGSSIIREMIGVTGKSTVHNAYYTKQGAKNAVTDRDKKILKDKVSKYWGGKVPELTPVAQPNTSGSLTGGK